MAMQCLLLGPAFHDRDARPIKQAMNALRAPCTNYQINWPEDVSINISPEDATHTQVPPQKMQMPNHQMAKSNG